MLPELSDVPLSGVKRTSRGHGLMSAFDPKRTSGRASICLAAQYFDIKRGLPWKGDYAPGCCFLLHGFALLILQFSLVEAHARIVIE